MDAAFTNAGEKVLQMSKQKWHLLGNLRTNMQLDKMFNDLK